MTISRAAVTESARRALEPGPRAPTLGDVVVLNLGLLAAAIAAVAVAAVGAPLPVLVVTGIAVGIVVLQRPDLATPVFLFIMYLNLPVIATQFHGVPPFVAAGAVLILLAPVGYHVLVRQEPIITTPALVFLFAYLFAQLISTLGSDNTPLSFNEVSVFLSEGLILYLLVSNAIRTPGQLRLAIWSLLLAGAVMGAISIWQEATHSYSNDLGGLAQINSTGFNVSGTTTTIVQPRLAGPVGEQNRYAQVLLVLVPLGFFRIVHERRPSLRALAAICTFMILAGVLLTFSRGAFVALIAMVAVAAALRYVRWSHLIAAALIAIVAMGVVTPAYLGRMASISGAASFFGDTTPNPDGAILGRVTENLAALGTFVDHPIIGVGPGQYFRAYSSLYANELGLRHLTTDRRAHNLYLETAADLGIIGISAFLAFAGATMLSLWRARRRWISIRPDMADLATGLWFGILGYLVSAIFLHLSYERYFFVLMAVAAAAVWILQHVPLPGEAADPSDAELTLPALPGPADATVPALRPSGTASR
jgi:putative inorganic carbon (HCO3(-)) transporter